MSRKPGEVVIYLEELGWQSREIVGKTEIARFRTIGWARSFIRDLADSTIEDYMRFAIVINGTITYITKDGNNEGAKSL